MFGAGGEEIDGTLVQTNIQFMNIASPDSDYIMK
jgi:hypothetical protein